MTVSGATAGRGGPSDDSSGDDGGGDAGGSEDSSGDAADDASGDYPIWDGNEIYNAGDRVVWDGRVWEAQWWTLNEEPRDEEWYVWDLVGEAEDESGSDSGGVGDSDDGSDGGDADSGSDDSGSESVGSDGDALAELHPSAAEVSVGETVTFAVADVTESDRRVDGLEVDFGDGTADEGWQFAHSYASPGTYTVTLYATDSEGATTTHEVAITVS